MICVQTFELNAQLREVPHLVFYVGAECLILRQEEINVAEVAVIIREANIIFLLVDALDRRWSPQIGMHFIADCGGAFCSSLLADSLALSLCPFTGFANRRMAVGIELDAENKALCNEIFCAFMRDVSVDLT